MSFRVAIDGHTAAGKGTLSKAIARAFGLRHLDTGLLYRATAARTLDHGGAPLDAAMSLAAADLTRKDLRTEAVARQASVVAAIPEVRSALLDFQRSFAAHPPQSTDGAAFRGAVLDGRDIGTVILPDAEVKLFITATTETRAQRRYQELLARGEKVIFAEVLADLIARDERDSNRDSAPTRAAEDAIVIDTSELDADQVFEIAKAAVIAAGLEEV